MKTRSAQASGVNITWLGHSAFKFITTQGKVVLIDPWLDNPKAPAGAKDLPKVDLILVTHGHGDHLGNTVEIAKRTKASVVAIYEIYSYLQRSGVTNAQGMNKGGTMNVDGVKVTMVDARHSSDIEAGNASVPGGEAAGFVIEFENGFKVYHAGDTAVFGDMKIIGQLYKPHVAMLPIGGFYTMDPREAAYACGLIKPKYIVGMHYGTFPALTGTPSELKSLLTPQLRKKVFELVPGEPITLA